MGGALYDHDAAPHITTRIHLGQIGSDARLLQEIRKLAHRHLARSGLDLVVVIPDDDARVAPAEDDALGPLPPMGSTTPHDATQVPSSEAGRVATQTDVTRRVGGRCG